MPKPGRARRQARRWGVDPGLAVVVEAAGMRREISRGLSRSGVTRIERTHEIRLKRRVNRQARR